MHMNHDHAGGAVINEGDKAVCPVMKLPVSKQEAQANGLVRNFEGKDYYLCCSGCIGSFENNPEDYVHDNDNHTEPR